MAAHYGTRLRYRKNPPDIIPAFLYPPLSTICPLVGGRKPRRYCASRPLVNRVDQPQRSSSLDEHAVLGTQAQGLVFQIERIPIHFGVVVYVCRPVRSGRRSPAKHSPRPTSILCRPEVRNEGSSAYGCLQLSATPCPHLVGFRQNSSFPASHTLKTQKVIREWSNRSTTIQRRILRPYKKRDRITVTFPYQTNVEISS